VAIIVADGVDVAATGSKGSAGLEESWFPIPEDGDDKENR